MATVKLHVRKGDTVKVIAGKDRGTVAEVIRSFPKEGRVVVKGCGMIKKSVRPTQANPRGGIITKEAPINASNVQLVCPKCNKPTRIGHAFDAEGKKVRVCKKCGAQF